MPAKTTNADPQDETTTAAVTDSSTETTEAPPRSPLERLGLSGKALS